MITYSDPHTIYSPRKSDPDTSADQAELPCPQAHSPTSPNPHKQSKIKSSLCKNYMLHGFCPYGDKCQFAHGPEELRCNSTSNTSYKTKPCFSFLNKGFCPYGHRCNFIHTRPFEQQPFWHQQTLDNFPQMAIQRGRSGSRLIAGLGIVSKP